MTFLYHKFSKYFLGNFPENYHYFFRKFPENFLRKFSEISQLTTLVSAVRSHTSMKVCTENTSAIALRPTGAIMDWTELNWGLCVIVLALFCVCFVLGMNDSSTVSPDVTLGNLGLDSVMVVEARQKLQRDFDISITPDEIRALTFAKIDQLSASTQQSTGDTTPACMSIRSRQ